MSIPLAASAYRVECRSERQPSCLASPLNHASDAHPAEAFKTFTPSASFCRCPQAVAINDQADQPITVAVDPLEFPLPAPAGRPNAPRMVAKKPLAPLGD